MVDNAIALQVQPTQFAQNVTAGYNNGMAQKSERMQQEAAALEQLAQIGFGVMDGKLDGPIDPARLEQAVGLLGDSPLAAKVKENPELLRTITKGSLKVLAASRDEQQFEMAKKQFELELANAQKGPAPMELSPGATVYDPASNKAVFTAPEAPKPPDVFGNEKDLFQQYSNSDPVKTYEIVKSSYERVKESAKQQSGAGDMGLIYGYMRMLDPGSVVRESEFAMAAQAGDYGEQIQGLVSQIMNGQRLPESQRKEFLANAAALYEQSAGNLADINAQFAERARAAQVDPKRFLREPEKYDDAAAGGEVTDWTDYFD